MNDLTLTPLLSMASLAWPRGSVCLTYRFVVTLMAVSTGRQGEVRQQDGQSMRNTDESGSCTV